jgi:hypothetical protein
MATIICPACGHSIEADLPPGEHSAKCTECGEPFRLVVDQPPPPEMASQTPPAPFWTPRQVRAALDRNSVYGPLRGQLALLQIGGLVLGFAAIGLGLVLCVTVVGIPIGISVGIDGLAIIGGSFVIARVLRVLADIGDCLIQRTTDDWNRQTRA